MSGLGTLKRGNTFTTETHRTGEAVKDLRQGSIHITVGQDYKCLRLETKKSSYLVQRFKKIVNLKNVIEELQFHFHLEYMDILTKSWTAVT